MGAPDVLQHLHAAGLHLALSDGKIIVTPRAKLTDDLARQSKTTATSCCRRSHRPGAVVIR